MLLTIGYYIQAGKVKNKAKKYDAKKIKENQMMKHKKIQTIVRWLSRPGHKVEGVWS